MPIPTIVSSAHAQVPRGESVGSMEQDSESPISFLLLFAAIVIYMAFKRRRADGTKALVFCASLAALAFFFPKIGLFIVGVIGVIVAIGLFNSLT